MHAKRLCSETLINHVETREPTKQNCGGACAQVRVRAGGDAEEHTHEVAPELNVGSLTAAVGLPRPRFFAGSARKGVRRGEEKP